MKRNVPGKSHRTDHSLGYGPGRVDNLSGKGKPLDLNDYFATPEDVRMGFSILKANDFAPEEVELMKEITALRERITSVGSLPEAATLRKEFRDKTLTLALLLEKRRHG